MCRSSVASLQLITSLIRDLVVWYLKSVSWWAIFISHQSSFVVFLHRKYTAGWNRFSLWALECLCCVYCCTTIVKANLSTWLWNELWQEWWFWDFAKRILKGSLYFPFRFVENGWCLQRHKYEEHAPEQPLLILGGRVDALTRFQEKWVWGRICAWQKQTFD